MWSGIRWCVAFPREIFESSPDLTQLGTLSGDEFTDQPSGKEHAPDGKTGFHEIDQGPESDPADYAPDDGDEANDDSEDEKPRSQHPEQEQWFSGKAELEPHGQHVENTDRDPSDAKLRLTGIPRI